MVPPVVSYHRTRLLYVGFYLTLAGVAATGLTAYFTDGHELRWAAAGLLLAFTLAAIPCQWPINFLSRRPNLYLTVQTGLVLGLLLLPPQIQTWAVLYILLSAQAMLLLPQRIGFLWIGLFTLAVGAGLVYGGGWIDGLIRVPLFGGGYFFFGTFAAATVRSEADRQRSEALLAELEDAHRRLKDYAAQAEELAATEERSRLARELHDSVTQSIFSMTLTSESARILLERDPSKAASELARLQELAKGALAEMRALIHQLRPTLVGEQGLVPALQNHLAAVKNRSGLAVQLRVEGEGRLRREQEEGLFRIVQEALNNVSKHAETDSAVVTLKIENGCFSLLVKDDGIGFDPSHLKSKLDSMGMASMRERAEQHGGAFSVESHPGEGTLIRVDFPTPSGDRSDG